MTRDTPPTCNHHLLRGVPTLRTRSAHTHRPSAHGLLEVPLHLPSPAKLFQRRIRVKIIEVAALDSSLARSPRSVGFPCGLPSRSSTQSCRRTPAKCCHAAGCIGTPYPVCVCTLCEALSRIELGSIDPNGRLLMCDSMHETAATPSVSLATVAMCVCVLKNYVFRQTKVYRVLAVYDLPT